MGRFGYSVGDHGQRTGFRHIFVKETVNRRQSWFSGFDAADVIFFPKQTCYVLIKYDGIFANFLLPKSHGQNHYRQQTHLTGTMNCIYGFIVPKQHLR
jgi:hypothetical protein